MRTEPLRAADSLLLLIDLQERLLPAIHEGTARISAVSRLLRGARVLDVPLLVTEQMPQRIGSTVSDIAVQITADEIVPKSHFSALRETEFRDKLARTGHRSVVIAGTEAHVCVMQTALALLGAGYEISLATDATGSRFEDDRAMAFRRMEQAGISLSTTETILFEWLEHADKPAFRDILPILKERKT